MPLLTAKQLKNRETPESMVDLGDGDQILVRRPDLQTLVFQNFLPMPLLRSVLTLISEWKGADARDVTEDIMTKSEALREFVDKWICAAAVEPRITADGSEGSVAVSDLTVRTKIKIFESTFSKEFFSPARGVAEAQAIAFHQDGPSAGSGTGSEEVQPTPVAAA